MPHFVWCTHARLCRLAVAVVASSGDAVSSTMQAMTHLCRMRRCVISRHVLTVVGDADRQPCAVGFAMVKKIINGRVVDVDDAEAARRGAGQPVPVFGGLHADSLVAALKDSYPVPYANVAAPGWALLGGVALVLFNWGLMPAVLVGAAVYMGIVQPKWAGAAPAPAGAPRGSNLVRRNQKRCHPSVYD